MGGSDEIDVVHTFVPQCLENIAQAGNSHRFTGVAPADLMILAKYAPQIAAGEKHRTGTAGAADAGFLAEMGGGTGHHWQGGGAAEAPRNIVAPCSAAAPGTLVADILHSIEILLCKLLIIRAKTSFIIRHNCLLCKKT